MRLKEVKFTNFKRFTDTRIHNLPPEARLIVLAGPNGSGKSSFFDGLNTWHMSHGAPNPRWDESYGAKAGGETIGWTERVQLEFHEPAPNPGTDDAKALFYIRSAFRNEADFNIGSFSRSQSPLENPKVRRLIDNDMSVAENYQRLIMATIDGVYRDDIPDTTTKKDLRERIIGRIRKAMQQVFPDLQLEGVGGSIVDARTIGTFYFSKGGAHNFLYMNLSAGEKAVFDLLLDAVIKSEFFKNSIWCIDEPEAHLNTRIQGALLETLLEFMPNESQLLLASHSIGFMRKAWEMARKDPGSAVFIDMQDHDFDASVLIEPTTPNRDFWARTLDVALGDLAALVAPERIVLCEGRPPASQGDNRAEFDAACYRKIFSGKYPDTDFMSVGNNHDVVSDRLEIGRAIGAITSGTSVIRVIDRDLRNDEEVRLAKANGVRVLSRRNLEAYLVDDEILEILCRSVEKGDLIPDVLAMKVDKMAECTRNGSDPDDWKTAAHLIYVALRKMLSLSNPGTTWYAFATGTLADLVTPGTSTFTELENDIFGP